MDAVEIIAHRGSSFLAPENTLAAANLAWQEGADAVEGDFRLTADGHIVCIHDATLKRTAGVDRRIVDCSLKELKSYDVGSWKGPEFAGERVPTLAELLATVPQGKRFFVEVKCDREIASELRRVIEQSAVPSRQVVLISLRIDVCSNLKQAVPECSVYWVVEFKPDGQGNWKPTQQEMGLQLEKHGRPMIDGLDLMATGPIDHQLATRYKSAGFALGVWTVDNPELARRLIDLGISGITTNRPGWLREQLQQSQKLESIGRLAAATMEGIARQPNAAGDIKTALFVAAGMIEGATLFGLVVTIILANKV
jgi:glycerophosphoryl diester phosphodiesterase